MTRVARSGEAEAGPDGLPILTLRTQAEWERWLAEHHATSRGVWLRLAKKDSGLVMIARGEALESALCFGWIDGQARSGDDQSWLQRFTPRRARSKWSQVNCAAVARLTADGRMQPAGLREVDAAKADGRWDAAYAPPSTITVPPDLQARLDASEPARAAFEQLDGRNRYAILYRLHDAKKPKTRARRLDRYIGMLEAGETIH